MPRPGSLVLLLSACSIQNPFFGLITDAGPGTDESAGETAATTATAADTGVATASSGGDEATSATSASSPTTSPDTDTPASTSGTTEVASTGRPPYVCDVEYKEVPVRVVQDLEIGFPWVNCDKGQVPQVFGGYGEMEGGALKFTPGLCENPDDVYKLELGHGYPAPDRLFCGKLSVYWAEGDECSIGALRVQEVVDNVPGAFIYSLYYSPTTVEPDFPYGPEIALAGSCGCEEVDQGCCEYDPGYHALKLGGVSILPGESKPVPMVGVQFVNYNATVDALCQSDPTIEMVRDWFAYRLP